MLVDILAIKITGSANVERVAGVIIAFDASEIASLNEVFAVPITEWSPTVKYVEESHHVHDIQLLALFLLQRIKKNYGYSYVRNLHPSSCIPRNLAGSLGPSHHDPFPGKNVLLPAACLLGHPGNMLMPFVANPPYRSMRSCGLATL